MERRPPRVARTLVPIFNPRPAATPEADVVGRRRPLGAAAPVHQQPRVRRSAPRVHAPRTPTAIGRSIHANMVHPANPRPIPNTTAAIKMPRPAMHTHLRAIGKLPAKSRLDVVLPRAARPLMAVFTPASQ